VPKRHRTRTRETGALQTGLKGHRLDDPDWPGQRELIIRRPQTGKTAIFSTHHHQKGGDVGLSLCRDRPRKNLPGQRVETLEKYGALDYTIIVSGHRSDAAPMQFVAPYSGCAMGEYFRDLGRPALIIYDDLSKHAVAYRQVSLLLRAARPRKRPRRHLQPAQPVVERPRKLNSRRAQAQSVYPKGGGSLTALPSLKRRKAITRLTFRRMSSPSPTGQIYLSRTSSTRAFAPRYRLVSRSAASVATRNQGDEEDGGTLRLSWRNTVSWRPSRSCPSDLDRGRKAQLGPRPANWLNCSNSRNISDDHWKDQVAVIWVATNGYLDGRRRLWPSVNTKPNSPYSSRASTPMWSPAARWQGVYRGSRYGPEESREEFKGLFSVK